MKFIICESVGHVKHLIPLHRIVRARDAKEKDGPDNNTVFYLDAASMHDSVECIRVRESMEQVIAKIKEAMRDE